MADRKLDPNDPEDVRRQRLTRAMEQDQREKDWSWLLSDPRGLRLLAEIINLSGALRGSFTGADPLMTAYLEGKRSIGLVLVAQAVPRAPTLLTMLDLPSA